MKARVKDEDLRGWISWSERKPEEGTRGIVIVCDGDGFQLVSMGEIDIKMIEAMWKNRTQDMQWSYLPKFKIGGNKVGGTAEKVSAFDNYCIFKEPEHKNINWEQRRYELAKDFTVGITSSHTVEEINNSFFRNVNGHKVVIDLSVSLADSLIKKLKGE